jgi:ferredoxin
MSCVGRCIACGKCVETCKFDAIHVNNYIAEIDYEKCTSCGACAKVCPTHAILNFRGERKERGILPPPKRNTKESVLSQTSEGME